MVKKIIKKDTLINYLLLSLSIVLACVVGELLLRFLGYYGMQKSQVQNLQLVQDEVLDYRLIPNSSWIYNNLRYQINQHGWRDDEHDHQKPVNTFRIVVLGDSVTHGYGVNVESTYAKQLEKKLNALPQSQYTYEVILIALEGINTEQEAHLLEIEGIKYHPNIVIIGYVLNDPANGSSLELAMLHAQGRNWKGKLKQFAAKSSLIHYTYKALKKSYWRLAIVFGKEDREDIARNDYLSMFYENTDMWNRVLDAFSKIQRIAQQQNIPVIVIIFPILHNLDNYQWKAIHSQVQQAAQGYGLRVIDLLDYYQTYPQHKLQVYNGDNIHPNQLGHEVASQALYQYLLENQLIFQEEEEWNNDN